MAWLTTETRNPRSEAIDNLSPREIVQLMNTEDARVAEAVGQEADKIAQVIEAVAERFRAGGRLIYFGAGTSGRLGILDAVECKPTFSAPAGMVVGLIAGGPTALTDAVEGAEDRAELAEQDLAGVQVGAGDAVIGIASSGRTPYVVAGLRYARQKGAFTVGFACNAENGLHGEADLVIAPIVGPEILTGSTRLKAGTATKMVLNMISTGAMILIGKTYGNLMVDLRATNRKLRDRAKRIVKELTGLADEPAEQLLQHCGGELKTAVVCQRRGVEPETARTLLAAAGGQLRKVID